MSLSHEQLQELNKYQEKFLSGEITAQEYEFAKSEILAGKDSKEEIVSENRGEVVLLGILKILWVIFKNILVGMSSLVSFLHKKVCLLSKRKNISLSKLYGIIGVSGIIVFLAIFGVIASINTYEEYERVEIKKKMDTERIIQEKQETEKRLAEERRISEEKAQTPQPSITLLSASGSLGKTTEYTLKFTATGGDIVTVNDSTITPNGSGTYEKTMSLPLGDTPITIMVKNKYFSDTLGFLISREKTDEEIRTEKEAEEKALAEQKEAERLAREEEKRLAEEKRQELEAEKKTYKALGYALLSKNPDKYKGERIRYRGQIFNADEEDNLSVFQINTDGYGYGDQIFTVADWSNDYVEGNWVTVWGVVAGEYCYQSQAGWDICVPSVKANIIE